MLRRVVLAPYGSAGDVYPFLWLGRALRERGLHVVVAAPAVFAGAAGRAGLAFQALGGEEEFHRLARSRGIWHPFLGTWHVLGALRPWLAEASALIGRLLRPGHSGLVASAPNLAATLAAARLGRPRVTVHLQPAAVFSAERTPVYGHGWGWLRGLPAWVKRRLLDLPTPADVVLGPELKRLCREAGVRGPRRILRDWWHSERGVVCLFPEWFAAPAGDWPRPLFQADFPLYEPEGQEGLPGELEEFLAGGEPPVAVTAGSAMGRGRAFFERALEAADALGARVVLVSAYEGNLPERLPQWACRVAYVAFWRLFPRCRAVVHHGGIGTTAQALAAGVPQLIVPIAHDQPDNAERVAGLGCGLRLGLLRRGAGAWKGALARLLGEERFAVAARDVARRLPPPGQCSEAAGVAEAVVWFLEGAGDVAK